MCDPLVHVWFGTVDEKSHLACTLLTKPRPANFPPKKVKFPVLTPTTQLQHLITPVSWFPFTLLNLGCKWLELSPEKWESDPDYKEMRDFARRVKLTNDVAERGVKLISDYSNILTKDSEERKRLVKAVQAHRRSYPQMRKMDLVQRITEKPKETEIEKSSSESETDIDDDFEWLHSSGDESE